MLTTHTLLDRCCTATPLKKCLNVRLCILGKQFVSERGNWELQYFRGPLDNRHGRVEIDLQQPHQFHSCPTKHTRKKVII